MKTYEISNVYFLSDKSLITILVLYVDNLFLTSSHTIYISSFKTNLRKKFKLKDLSLIDKLLSAQTQQLSCSIFLYQIDYTCFIFQKYKNFIHYLKDVLYLLHFKFYKQTKNLPINITKYQGLISQLLYLIKIRLNINFSTFFSSQYSIIYNNSTKIPDNKLLTTSIKIHLLIFIS